MRLVSMKLPLAFALGAMIVAWRASAIAPPYSRVQFEMEICTLAGAVFIALGCFWELLRWYQRMDRRYLSDGNLGEVR